MAAIDRKDILSDDAIKTVIDFAGNWAKVGDNLDGVIGKLKNVEQTISKSESTTKLTAEYKKLGTAQTDVGKIQKQIQDIQAKTTVEYIKEVHALDAVKKALKDKIALGDRDAKTITATNASIKQLTAALNANRAAYDAMTTAEERNSKEGKELLVVIKEQDKDLKALKKEYGQNQLEVGNYENATKNLKLELRAAQSEMVGIAATLGQDSEEFKKAAERAGDLKDQLGDIAEATSAVSGEPIERLSGSFGLLVNKLQAGDFKGATAGIKGITQASKDLTFKQAIAGLGGFGKSFAALGKAIFTNPLFIIAGVIALISIAVFKLKDSIPFLAAAFDAVGDAIDFMVQKGKDFLDFVGLTTFALDDKAKKVIESSKKEIDAIEERYSREIKLAAAAGKETLDLEIQKNKELIAEATKGIIELDGLRKRQNGKFIGDQQKQWDEYLKVVADANTEIQALQLAHDLELAKKAKERMLREQGDAVKLSQFLIQNEIDKNKAIQDNELRSIEDRISASEKVDSLRRELATIEKNNALKAEDLTASGRKLIYAKFQQDLTDITEDGTKARNKITADVLAQDKKILEVRIESQKAGIIKQAEEQHRAIEAEIQAIKEAAIAKGFASEEVDKQIAKKRKQLADDQVQVQIDAMRKILMIEGLSAKEREEVEKELYKLKTDLTNAYYEGLEAKEKTGLEKAKAFIDKYTEAFGSFITSVSDLASAFTDRRLQDLDLESEASEEKADEVVEKEKASLEASLKNDQLTTEQKDALKENSAKRQEAIELANEKRQKDIEAQRKKAIRKQAIFDKAVALTIGGIKLAQAILAMLSVGPAGFALSALAAAIGAVQLATIAARPIPAAEKGLQNHKGGPVLAGEKGDELIKSGNNWSITKGMGVYDVAKGSQIFPHEESMRMIAMSGLTPERENRRIDANADVRKELQAINKTIKSKPAHIIQGRIVGAQVGGTRQRYLNSLRNAS